MPKDKVVKTYSIGASSFFCENCGHSTHSTNTTMRIYKSGAEVQVDHCEDCKVTQETEFIKGPTTRVKNKENKQDGN